MHLCRWNCNTNISHGFVPYYLISALSFHGFFGGIYFILFNLQRDEEKNRSYRRSVHVRTTFKKKQAYARYAAALTRIAAVPSDPCTTSIAQGLKARAWRRQRGSVSVHKHSEANGLAGASPVSPCAAPLAMELPKSVSRMQPCQGSMDQDKPWQ